MEQINKEKHFAFNVWSFESAKAVIDAAALAKQDVILQTSTGVFKAIETKQFSSFVKEYSLSKRIHAWINLDHCKEKEILFDAVDSGWDMIMVDGSSMAIQDNIAFTNEIAKYAHDKNVLVEAEVGQIKGIEEDVKVQQDKIATKKEIALFLSQANIDFIAVAFGNAHGEYKVEPVLHYDLVEYTTAISPKPFVVHGGSGLSDIVLSRLLSIKGVMKINISTDLKIAYKNGINKAMQNWKQPLETSKIIHDEIVNVVSSKLRLIRQ